MNIQPDEHGHAASDPSPILEARHQQDWSNPRMQDAVGETADPVSSHSELAPISTGHVSTSLEA